MIRTGSNRLMSSYVNVDGEPIFYKTTNTSWVANELNFGRELFYMECIREPPEWFLWVRVHKLSLPINVVNDLTLLLA